MAEVNISDIVRHIIMSNETEDANEDDIKRLTFFLEQHQERNSLQPMQFATVMRVANIDYTSFSSLVKTLVSANIQCSDNQIHIREGREESLPSSVSFSVRISDVLLTSLSPRAGPLAASL